MRQQDRWTEADAIAHAQHHGLALDPALTVRPPTSGMDPETPEGVLLARIRRLATDNGYISYHTHDSRKSEVGFPDLLLAKPETLTSAGRILFVELKSSQGKVTREQHLWLDILTHTVPGVEVYLWRPRDWPTIQQILQASYSPAPGQEQASTTTAAQEQEEV